MRAASPSVKNVMEKNLTGFFSPRTVAVIGASPNPAKIGNQILRNIVDGGYQGAVYPVNPNTNQILNLKAYAAVGDIPADIDLAVITIPQPAVKTALEQCARKGVKCVALITSGFAEVGKTAEEEELRRIADAHGMALLGPNMFGLVYEPSRLNASFGPVVSLPGRIAFITQSGALGISLMGWTEMEHIGLAALVSVGNKADVEERELIEYFNQDRNVDVILIYMEGVKSGRNFMKTRIKKPVVVLKVGRSGRGARAAASHTGSLAGSDKIYDAAFKQLGVLRAGTFTEAFGWSRTLCLPVPQGDENTLIITNGGGIGVRATDECESVGIRLLDDPLLLESRFRVTMPDFGSTRNPVDITGQASEKDYSLAVGIALLEEKVKEIIVLYCETVITDPLRIAQAIEQEYEDSLRGKPMVVAMVGGERTRSAIHYLNERRIPAFVSISEAVSALKVLHHWKEIINRPEDDAEIIPPPPEALDIIARARGEGRDSLLEHEARRVLELCGVPAPKWAFARSLEESVAAAVDLYPLAMKIASPDILHKTEVEGVALNIHNAEELKTKYENMMRRVRELKPGARVYGVNLVQMIKGIECIVGMTRDPQFGPVVMFGLGGIFVEVLKDVSFRVVPFGALEAERLVRDIKGGQVLEGFRGMRAHKPSIIHALSAVQRLAGVVGEVDINPLLTNQQGSFAVDARIIL
jgi:acetyltransferase